MIAALREPRLRLRLGFAGLLCALLLVLAAPPMAQADFTVAMCNGKTAAPWVNGVPDNDPFVGIQDECSTSAGSDIFFISGTDTMPAEALDEASIVAPAGESFTHLTAQFHSDADIGSSSATALSWGYDKTYLTTKASGDANSGTSVSADLPNASSIFLHLWCYGTQPCAFADNDVIRVGEFDLTVHDTGVPAVHAIGGSLAQPGTYAGIQTLGFAASDTGSGVSHVTVALGSTVAGAYDVSCQSASLTPCPANASGIVDVNTDAVGDGTYPVILTAYDASGDPSPTQVGIVRVRNHVGTVSLPRPERGVRARVAITWEWSPARTVLTRISLAGVPKAATVTVACRGRRCPIRVLHAGRRGLRRFARALRGRAFVAGQRIELEIAAPGRRPERAQIIIRRDAIPQVRRG